MDRKERLLEPNNDMAILNCSQGRWETSILECPIQVSDYYVTPQRKNAAIEFDNMGISFGFFLNIRYAMTIPNTA